MHTYFADPARRRLIHTNQPLHLYHAGGRVYVVLQHINGSHMLRIWIWIFEPDGCISLTHIPSAACENAQGNNTVVENERGIGSPHP